MYTGPAAAVHDSRGQAPGQAQAYTDTQAPVQAYTDTEGTQAHVKSYTDTLQAVTTQLIPLVTWLCELNIRCIPNMVYVQDMSMNNM